ncbi:uncharacterized protein DUF1838 [Maribacter vaceletii]|uniref:Uncharacterized protein DUF1838 n=1 Tax=Maribacter vaceletii TaxID=1206816 RepID=A0A495EE61_9FLAO|nr:DUF1838 family protein [Maribacter vaceletii]RKR15210.1 uncharacterized protein DUF1838 [Maribacter vaceletii]
MRLISSLFLAFFIFMGCKDEKQLETQKEEKEVLHPSQDKKSYKHAPEPLKTWVNARAGTGKPVHWIAEGSVYEYPSGKKLFGMIGFDSSTIIWPEEENGKITHLTRKTFAYTDPETGEVITEYNGNKVEPIAYPYQMITYRLENNKIFGDVEQGVGERVQQIKAKEGIPYRKMGNTFVYNASVFLDFPLPSGTQYQAWENYDFFIHPEATVEEPHQMSWQRYGKLPKWAGDGHAIIQLYSWRVESHEEFPSNLLNWAKEVKPKWLNPPKDVAEIRALQKGKAGAGWGR